MTTQTTRIVAPDELEQFLAGRPSLLVHVASPEHYARAHIAGAVNVAPASLVCGIQPATGRLPDAPSLQALAAHIGYDPALTIVAYDDEGGGRPGEHCDCLPKMASNSTVVSSRSSGMVRDWTDPAQLLWPRPVQVVPQQTDTG